MILALDSYYKDDICNTSLVVFENKDSDKSIYEDTIYTKVTSEYIPGEFYKRELPGIVKILEKLKNEHEVIWNNINTIILDSFIYLQANGILWKGLGAHLKLICELVASKEIIGVAKSNFGECDKISVLIYRGKSKTPLYVQSSHNSKIASKLIKQMHGNYRIPTMLKLVDQKSRIFV